MPGSRYLIRLVCYGRGSHAICIHIYLYILFLLFILLLYMVMENQVYAWNLVAHWVSGSKSREVRLHNNTHTQREREQVPPDSLTVPSSGHMPRLCRCNPSSAFSNFVLLSTLSRPRIFPPGSTFAAVCPRRWLLPVSEDAARQCALLSPAVRRAARRGGRLDTKL